jgi:hypothetical protein
MALVAWVLVCVAASAALAAPFWLAHYLNRLPFAPECPQCKGVTSEEGRPALLDRLHTPLAGAPVRRCHRCGWQGRMRWRWAHQHARHRGARR